MGDIINLGDGSPFKKISARISSNELALEQLRDSLQKMTQNVINLANAFSFNAEVIKRAFLKINPDISLEAIGKEMIAEHEENEKVKGATAPKEDSKVPA